MTSLIDHAPQAGIALASGAVVFAQEVPAMDLIEKGGLAGIAVILVWWMLFSFSKRLDAMTEVLTLLRIDIVTHGTGERREVERRAEVSTK